jgi:hypothetical protein
MQRGDSSSDNVSIRFEIKRSSFAIEITTFAAKKPQPLYEIWNEKGILEKELRPQANNAQYNTQGGWGVVRREWERGGGAGGSFTQTYG